MTGGRRNSRKIKVEVHVLRVEQNGLTQRIDSLSVFMRIFVSP